MGLDPPTLITLSPLLHNLAKNNAPRLLLALRPQDPIPEWITHLVYLDPSLQVAAKGSKDDVLEGIRGRKDNGQITKATQRPEVDRKIDTRVFEGECAGLRAQHEREAQILGAIESSGKDVSAAGEPLLEMENIQVKYGNKHVLGGWVQDVRGKPQQGFSWTVRRGQRWGIFGPNGEYYLF